MGNHLHMVLIAALFCCPSIADATDALPPLPQETYRALSTFEKRIMAAQEQAVQDRAVEEQMLQEPVPKTIPARRKRHPPRPPPEPLPVAAPEPKPTAAPVPLPPKTAPLPPKRGKIK